MKIAEINIGLSSKSLGEISEVQALYELNYFDFRVIQSRIVESTSEDGKELCLACKVELPEHWQAKLASVAENLGQDCIAVAGFIGRAPYDTFAPELWVSPEDGINLIEGLKADLVDAEARAKDFERQLDRALR